MGDQASLPNEEALRAEIIRLNKVVKALMNRAERAMSAGENDFGLFQATIMLEGQVRDRTRELEAALQKNEEINQDLQRERGEQQKLIRKLEDAQLQLLQSEKLASIGQLAAGVAHEINNPMGFIISNLASLGKYVEKLTARRSAPAEIDYILEDMPGIIAESSEGAQRIRKIVQDLRSFSRIDGADHAFSDINDGLETTLNIAWNELKYKVTLIKEYGQIPLLWCNIGQLNQVFLNLLVNAVQAIEDRGEIRIRTWVEDGSIRVAIGDSGCGIPAENLSRIFDPFFTTKDVGKGTGLGLAIAYDIVVNKHGGQIGATSEVGKGSVFTLALPIKQEGGKGKQA